MFGQQRRRIPRNWYNKLVSTRRSIRIHVRVFNLADRYSRVWLLYGTHSRNTRKARQGFFRYLKERYDEFYTDFTTREISGMRIGYDLRNRLQRDVYISAERIVGDTPSNILREGGYDISVDVDFDEYWNGYEDAVSTRLKR
ncbi:MAG: hypothetical protein ACETWK_14590 [Candidatus Aminicenantaceae bacterium]